jgi:hypothetical protein
VQLRNEDKFWHDLYASNNDCAQPNLIDDFYNGCYFEYHPAGSLKEAQILLSMDEIGYERAERMTRRLRFDPTPPALRS